MKAKTNTLHFMHERSVWMIRSMHAEVFLIIVYNSYEDELYSLRSSKQINRNTFNVLKQCIIYYRHVL